MKLDALIWKYGHGVLTAHVDKKAGNVIIDKWKHPSLSKPSDKEIQEAIEEYATYVHNEEQKYSEYLSKISDLDYDEIDNYIDQITNLSSAKIYLKRLSHVVLALVKILKDKKEIK